MFCWYFSIGANATSGYSRMGEVNIPSFLSGKDCKVIFHVDARQSYDGYNKMRVTIRQSIDHGTLGTVDTTYVEANKAYEFSGIIRAASDYIVTISLGNGNAMSAELYLTMIYRDVTTSYSTESIITASKANELLTATGFASQYTISQGSKISKECYKAMANACNRMTINETSPTSNDLLKIINYINGGNTITREFDRRG